MRLKLTIAYDGRPFSGWATQPSRNTVQDYIQNALAEICKEKVTIYGAGRTDTGVHADGQVAHFDAPASMTMQPQYWVPSLNTKLPKTIRIMRCTEVADDFHARFSADAKTYKYSIGTNAVLHPMMAGRAWHIPHAIDLPLLDAAMQHYIGTHDFRAFAALRGNETKDTDHTRTITQSAIQESNSILTLTFTGNGFLYKMVRLMVGAAVHVAQGRLELQEHLALLNQNSELPHGRSPYCAPADGLNLVQVAY